MKRPIIQRSFVLSYVAIAVVTAATGLVLRSMPSISADYNKHGRTSTSSVSATATITGTEVFTWKACVDGSANLEFSATDPIVKILNYNYKPIGTHTDCASKFKDTAPLGTYTGTLDNCKTVRLGNSNSNRVSIASATSPFKVSIKDNGTGPFEYEFALNCVEWISESPTPSATAAESTKSLTFKKGFNAVVPPEGYTYDTGAISSAGMYLFDFNRLGQKNWRSTAHGGTIAYMVNQIGYYVYNPGDTKAVSVKTNPSAYVESSEDKIKVRRGWNLLSNPNSSSLSLANFYLNTLKKDADAACLDESCYESVTLYSLLSGTAATSRGYGTLYEITDGNASEASKAFTKVNVTSSNINSVAISQNRAFWFYLFE